VPILFTYLRTYYMSHNRLALVFSVIDEETCQCSHFTLSAALQKQHLLQAYKIGSEKAIAKESL
jgi:hypothetical protein